MFNSGLVSVTFRQLEPREIVSLVAQAGLDGIEWGGDIHVPHGNLETAREVSAMTRDSGLEVFAYGSYYRVGDENDFTFDDVLKTALELGAPTIRVWAGRRGSADADEDYWARVVADSRRIADAAGDEGLTVSYEYHVNTLTDTNESALRLLEEVGHASVRTLWQPPNDKDADYCLEGLRAVLPWLTNVHVFHRQGDGLGPLFGGADVWNRYIKEIEPSGRGHALMLEFVRDKSPEAFLEDAAALKELLR